MRPNCMTGARREIRRRAVEHCGGDLGEGRVLGQVEEEPHPQGGRLQRVHLLPRGQHRPQGVRDQGEKGGHWPQV